MTDSSNPTDAIQWGALIVLPTGANDVEIGPNRDGAIATVHSTNRAVGADVATLVYRTVRYGPWQSEQPADEWGVRYTWPSDGHVEVEPRANRAAAGRSARIHQGTDSVAEVVSRRAEYGDWWLTSAPAHRT